MFEKLFRGAASSTGKSASSKPQVAMSDEGISYSVAGTTAAEWLAAPFALPEAAELGAKLSLLYLDGFGEKRQAEFVMPWRDVYAALADDNHANASAALQLPANSGHRPMLTSQGSLGDATFRVMVSHWVDEHGAQVRQAPKITGGTIESGTARGLLQQPVWALLQQLKSFHAAPTEERTPVFNERAWAQMRRWAVESHAPMSDYLENTVILTPEKLRLDLRSSTASGEKVLEVTPGFDGAPARWLEMFDSMPLQDTYSVPDGKSLTKVVLSDPVKRMLAEIKRMPARRVTGARAEAFVRNPMAVLGESAAEAVSVTQVEQALVAAGVSTERFTPDSRRDERGALTAVFLRVETFIGYAVDEEELEFRDADDLAHFCHRLDHRISVGHQCCGWQGHDFDIAPESAAHLRQLRAWLNEWRHAAQWSANDLFDLSHYSDRVAEIGVEKPYAMPFIQKRAVDLDWFVDNVLYGLAVRPPDSTQTTLVPIAPDDLPALRDLIEVARSEGKAEVLLPNAPGPVPIADAQRAIDAIETAEKDIRTGDFDPARKSPEVADTPKPRDRKQLVIKSNIDIVDHIEARAHLLAAPPGTQPDLPSTLRPETALKTHQLDGVAWLQHLWSHSPGACRGALLADDMGLGKTLQLLTFIAGCLEKDPKLDPVLVVAPVALLENWRAEVEKFFSAGALPVLTLYGSTLKALRVPPAELDPDLAQHGITKLLRKDWTGGARIVLTTYETLRDMEFTLAAQAWSIMVCDEAQKIKNPNAMVTRSAKKQKVRFRIPCTGTPVENTLLDLWCLFDFVQPGMLGALNQFSRTYRQPIEAKTDEQKAKVAELRKLIEPQTLRRTKQEVAGDVLPRKDEHEACRTLPMSQQQTTQYWSALDRLKLQKDTDPSAMLQTLHHLRRLCSDPHWQQPEAALRMPLKQVLDESPKMRWLVGHLETLQETSKRTRGEKVIIFCEFRDLQTLLQRVVRDRFAIDAYVVNGDTSASMEVENSRQKLIDRFQQRPGFNIIILSPLAVGFGVNIQAANHVVHFTRTWNPAKEDQATDRAYRIGQDRDVTVYYPSVVGSGFESFDTVLHKLLTWKRGIASDMLNAGGDLSVADFSAMQV